VIADREGLPLLVVTTPANVPDQVPFVAMLDALPAVRTTRGGRRKRPSAAVGDAAYGTREVIGEVVARRVFPMLAPRRRKEHGSGLGVVRYVIERTLAWLGNFRRLKICYERTGPHWQAMHELAACLVLNKRVEQLPGKKKAA
jgi:transposase